MEMYDAGLIVASRPGDVTAATTPDGPQGGFAEEAVRRLGSARTDDIRELIAAVERCPPARPSPWKPPGG
ncbi:hypothetical protein [Kitasatospora sp. NBC_01300]|uniref:hypothetical protein n=1 Tax=Kitasatospora sp. NBC_01300 TaxID=2903574 RepID=UPI002F90E36D|nr:hypothetical protein OG556_34800 [Kitasatospora sp. NBC_01300]